MTRIIVYLLFLFAMKLQGFAQVQNPSLTINDTLTFAPENSKESLSQPANNQVPLKHIFAKSISLEDKIIEVNFEKNIFVIHSNSIVPGNGYSSLPLKIKDSMPFVEVTMASNNETIKGWFGLDPGYMGSFVVGHLFAFDKHLFEIFDKFGTSRRATTGMETVEMDIVKIPKVSIGTFETKNVTAELQRTGRNEQTVLGNDFLKRFNFLIDNQNNLLWLKPNNLLHTRYSLEKDRRQRDHLFFPPIQIAASLAIFMILFLIIFLITRKRRNTQLN